jgi:peptidoglycan/LPS O-acetylase OafA/YrhL
MSETNSQYRHEVDGLRAVAIVFVVLFHFHVPGFSGGFVGVDIFFVVSGYLITRNIVSGIALDRFTFLGFYARLARRILPSYLVVAAVVLLAGFVISPPEMFMETARSAAWATFFGSNILFWSQSGYFDASKYVKPLLHTWSLGIEEQFYLFWPLFLFAGLRFLGPRVTVILLILGTCASLALATAWLSATTVWIPVRGTVIAKTTDVFFLLPYRLWELALGGLCAFAPDAPQSSLRAVGGWRSVIVAGACIVVGYCVIEYQTDMIFPGPSAVPPVLAAATIILAGRETKFQTVSSLAPVRYLGQLSYTLYLVHWPVIVYWRLVTFEKPDIWATVALIALSITLAALLSKFVETPFREGRYATRLGMTPSGWAFVSSMAVLVLLAARLVSSLDGLPFRMRTGSSPIIATSLTVRSDASLVRDNPSLVFNGWAGQIGAAPIAQQSRRGLVIGDSHAGHWAIAFDRIGKDLGITFDYMSFPGCPPLFGLYKIYTEVGLKVDHPTQVACRQMVSYWRARVETGLYDLVVIGGRWDYLTEPIDYGDLRIEYAQLAVPGEAIPRRLESYALLGKGLDATIEAAHQSGAGVLLLGQVPHAGRLIEGCGELSRYISWGFDPGRAMIHRCRGVERVSALNRVAYSDGTIAARSRGDVIGFLPSHLLCAESAAPCATVVDGKLLYKNSDHISERGALYMAPALALAVKCVLAARDGDKHSRAETAEDLDAYTRHVLDDGVVIGCPKLMP